PGHDAALRRCLSLFAGRDEIVVPSIFDLEVTSALVRRGVTPARVAAFFERHLASRRLVSIGPRVVRAVRTVVNVTRLRAADALLALSLAEIEEWCAARGHERYRAAQVLIWVYRRHVGDFAAMLNVPRALREQLTAEFRVGSAELAHVSRSADGTRKLLFRLD